MMRRAVLSDTPSARATSLGLRAASFNGRFRDERLNMEWFRTRAEAVILIESWRRHYNEIRPHSSIDYLTPNEFRTKNLTTHGEALLS